MKLDHSPIEYDVSRCKSQSWICFLHAAFADHEMFRQQVDFFTEKYNILILDIIGHGRSGQTKKGDSIEKMTLWLLEIMDAEKIEKVHLVGVSLGSVLAQDFANHYPERVASLACFGGYDINHFDPQMQQENSAAQMLIMAKALFSIKWFAQANKKIYAFTQEAQEAAFKMNLRFPRKSFMYLAGLGTMVNKYETGLRPYPLLIGCGAHDIPMECKAVELWKTTEPGCQVVIFENAGHCVNMDVPDQFNRVMEDFWKNV